MNLFSSLTPMVIAAGLAEAEGGGPLLFIMKSIRGLAPHVHTYPGATSPFGMIQLSPDT